jgi:hypothetical protein
MLRILEDRGLRIFLDQTKKNIIRYVCFSEDVIIIIETKVVFTKVKASLADFGDHRCLQTTSLPTFYASNPGGPR